MKAVLVFLLAVSWRVAFSQEHDLQELTDNLTLQQDDIDNENRMENFIQSFVQLLDLNKATREQLEHLSLLSPRQIQSFLFYREHAGPLMRIYELQVIEEFDQETCRRLKPLVIVPERQRNGIRNTLRGLEGFFIARAERRLGHKTSSATHYTGLPERLYSRLHLHSGEHFNAGAVMEKDADEPIQFNTKRRYFVAGHTAAYVQWKNYGRINNLIVGNYQFQFGQGLLLGGGFAQGKGGDLLALRKSTFGFSPYASVSEQGYMHGVATSLKVSKSIDLSIFYSATRRSGTGETDSSFRSFDNTGIFKVKEDLDARKNINEKNIGIAAVYRKQQIEIGWIVHRFFLSKMMIPKQSTYNQFQFTGSEIMNTGFFWNAAIQNHHIFGEVGHSLEHGWGVVAGSLSSLSTKVDMGFLVRHYQPNFYTMYANAFSEQASTSNETGLFWGWNFSISKKFQIRLWADLFRFPWLRSRTYSPSSGKELLFRTVYSFTKKSRAQLQLRLEENFRNIKETENQLYQTTRTQRLSGMLHFSYEYSKAWSGRIRFQANSLRDSEAGYYAAQDIIYKKPPFKFYFRFCLFDIPTSDTRMYVYENDVWLAYSMPAFSGSGTRTYMMAEYKVNSRVQLALRISRTQMTSVIPGNEQSGNTTNDIKLQTTIRW